MNILFYLVFLAIIYIVYVLDIFDPEKRMSSTQIEASTHNEFRAFLDNSHCIQVVSNEAIPEVYLETKKFTLKDSLGKKIKIESQVYGDNQHIVILHTTKALKLSNKDLCQITIYIGKTKLCNLSPRGILFENLYSEKMGMHILEDKVTFRCFAPTAKKVSILLYNNSRDSEFQEHAMQEKKTGLWTLEFSLDCINQFYKYRVYGSDFLDTKYRDVMDPYSYFHQHRFSKSMIVKDSTQVSDGPSFPRSKAIIYEVHIRDFSISDDSGMTNKGKYLAFNEKDTHLPKDSNIKTGLAHLKELGVNVIHLLPVQNFDQDDNSDQYDWGYMPVHYFCLHGSYATSPLDLSRITEFKTLVSTLHDEGFKVVIDVVFNHTAEDLNNPISFQGLAPGYYYRRTGLGDYFNGSGCGNEFKTEAPMARSFILDNLRFWMTEYKIDGFRFDLMGLMDYETFLSVERELQKINSDVLLYGEPWVAGDCGIEVTGKGAQRQLEFAVFNDHFRDSLRGENNGESRGFVQGSGDYKKIWDGIRGAIDDFTHHPTESINYVACHDNYTLSDKLTLSLQAYENLSDDDYIRCEKLNALLVFTSQGIPFIQSGQEFRRSKQCDHNSYQSSDSINQINWQDKADNLDLFQFYKDLITLRRQHKILRLTQREQVQQAYEYIQIEPNHHNLFSFKLSNPNLIDSFESLIFVINPKPTEASFNWSDTAYKQIISSNGVILKTKDALEVSGEIILNPFDFMVFGRFNQE
ncbi:MAG: type I pullulanase [Candidatus Cloacimonetes bacterium]|nr:type I pullulanase [Candidatus Cloacimonadota bacterium]